MPVTRTMKTDCPAAFLARLVSPAPRDWDIYARNPTPRAEIVLPISQLTVLVAPTDAVALVPKTPTIAVSIYCTAVCMNCSSIVGHASAKITGNICLEVYSFVFFVFMFYFFFIGSFLVF